MAAVADNYSQITALGAEALAISADSVLAHKVFRNISPGAAKVGYPLVSDQNGLIAKSYGVLTDKGVAQRATFIIDPDGRIRYFSVYPDAVGRNVPEIIRTLQALQFADTQKQGAPAGWQPGMPGITPNLEDAGKY